MEIMSTGIAVKLELFEHGVFPTPPKLNLMNIITLFNSLNLVSSIDFKITLDQFKDCAIKSLPFLTLKDAEIYFVMFKILTEDDLSFLNKISSQNQSINNGLSKQMLVQNKISLPNSGLPTADLRLLSIFLYLQLLPSSMRHNSDLKQKEFNTAWGSQLNLQFNESIRGGNLSHFGSPINSPRSKHPKIGLEIQQIHYFIKTNIKTILKFLSNDVSVEDTTYITTTETEFNLLKMIFSNEKINTKIISTPSTLTSTPSSTVALTLSKFSGLYSISSKTSLNALSDWITNNLIITESGNILNIQGLNRAVTIKDYQSCKNKEIRISCCEDSYIYIDSSVKSVSIVNCINMSIFIASVRKVCTIDKCENVTITVAANLIRIGNTIDSTINYYGSYNPILYGDNRSLIIGPFNANYLELIDRIKEAEISISIKNIQAYDDPIILNAGENNDINHRIQRIEDFTTIILPDNFKYIPYSSYKNYDPLIFGLNEKLNPLDYELSSINTANLMLPILCPNVYRDQIKQRFKAFNDIQNDLKLMNLTEEEQKLMHFTIQSMFKDWLVNTGSIKPVLEMVKMIDKE